MFVNVQVDTFDLLEESGKNKYYRKDPLGRARSLQPRAVGEPLLEEVSLGGEEDPCFQREYMG